MTDESSDVPRELMGKPGAVADWSSSSVHISSPPPFPSPSSRRVPVLWSASGVGQGGGGRLEVCWPDGRRSWVQREEGVGRHPEPWRAQGGSP